MMLKGDNRTEVKLCVSFMDDVELLSSRLYNVWESLELIPNVAHLRAFIILHFLTQNLDYFFLLVTDIFRRLNKR